MVPVTGVGKSLGSVLTKDLGVFVVMGGDNLVPWLNHLVGSVFCQLLCNGGLCGMHGVDLHDMEI